MNGTYITFKPGPPKPKTLTWFVYPKEGIDHLGIVQWYGPWRKYCFFPEHGSLYEQVCLREIADFCEQRTREHGKLKITTTPIPETEELCITPFIGY